MMMGRTGDVELTPEQAAYQVIQQQYYILKRTGSLPTTTDQSADHQKLRKLLKTVRKRPCLCVFMPTGIVYGKILRGGQRPGVTGIISRRFLIFNPGSEASSSIYPPGFRTINYGSMGGNAKTGFPLIPGVTVDRGHLWGNQLGGDGSVASNIVSFASSINSGKMNQDEGKIKELVMRGYKVCSTADPIYDYGTNVPKEIDLEGVAILGFGNAIPIDYTEPQPSMVPLGPFADDKPKQ
jgi:hypothetical protein